MKDAQKFFDLPVDKTYTDRDLENYFLKKSVPLYKEKVQHSAIVPRELGNLYTGSLYSGLVGLLSFQTQQLTVGKRVLLFSYGSGLSATLFSFTIKGSITHIADAIKLQQRLDGRILSDPADYTKTMDLRATRHLESSFVATDPIEPLWPNTYYLTEIDSKMRRIYKRKGATGPAKL